MPSTFSPLKIQLMATGENNTTWGDVTNLNLGTALEEAIVGSADVTFASADVTLTLTDTNASQTARNMRLRCTGTTGGATRNLIVPSIEKPYIVRNDCADSVVVKTAAGTGITVPAGRTMWVYTDATNVVDAVTHLSSLTLGTSLPVSSGGTGTNTAFTAGSVVFAGASGVYTQDNANLFWDNTNDRLGIGTATPAAKLDVIGNIRMPSGNFLYWAGGSELIEAVENNRMTFFVSSLERMRIASNGDVGIGTTSITPLFGRTLQIGNGSVNSSISLIGTGAANIGDGYMAATVDAFSLTARGSTPLVLGANDAEAMRITSGGNVAIGTTSSSIKLQVSDVDQATARIGVNNANGQNYHLVAGNPGASNSGFAIFDATASATRMYIDSSGNVGVGTQGPSSYGKLAVIGNIAASTDGATILTMRANAGATTLGAYNTTASSLSFTTNTGGAGELERMRITDTGNVGIGTASPSDLLHVAGGNVRVSGATPVIAVWNAAGSDRYGYIFGQSGSMTFAAEGASRIMSFSVAGSERMRISSTGDVGVGGSSPGTKFYVNGGVAIHGASFPTSGVGIEALWDGTQSVIQSYNRNVATYQPLRLDGSALQLFTSGTEKARITSGGDVGIGTSSPAYKLQIQNAGNLSTLIRNGNAGTGLYSELLLETGNTFSNISQASVRAVSTNGGNADIALTFGTSSGTGSTATERMRIDASGNVGIGTSSPAGKLHTVSTTGFTAPNLLCTDTVSNFRIVFQSSLYAAVPANKPWLHSYDDIYLGSDGTTSFNVVSGGINRFKVDSSGYISLGSGTAIENSLLVFPGGVSGTPLRRGIKLGADPEGTFDFYINSNQNNAAFRWFNGLGSSEMMRLNSSGDLMVGTTTSTSATQRGVVSVADATGGASAIIIGHANGVASGNSYAVFSYNGGIIGAITQNGTTGVLYTTASDVRLKHNIVDAPDAASVIDAMQVRSFKWNADNNEQRYGFIAQELLEVAPEAVNQPADPDEMMAVDYSKLVPILVKEIQSLRARVAQLEGN